MLNKCLNSDLLLQYVSIPSELNWQTKFKTRWHLKKCSDCSAQFNKIQDTWNHYFTPEPDIAPSLIRVFAKLQRDETLILKGWKLSNIQSKPSLKEVLVNRGWLYYGAIASSFVGVISFFTLNQASMTPVAQNEKKAPVARIQFEEKNGVNVYYVKPELLHRVQFQTTRTNR